MPLMTLTDFHAGAILTKGKQVYRVAPERLNATDISRTCSLKGNHMQVVVNRSGGMKETIHDN